MKTITLVTGGARSGKSTYALQQALTYPEPRAFVATAEPFDDEMRRRIARHQQERASDFVTYEAPVEPDKTLLRLPPQTQIAVLDCLTVWLGNLLHHVPMEAESRMKRLVEFLDRVPCDLILVTNEVGLGVVPHNALARQFRDLAGTLNQQIAARADRVVLLVSGCPMIIKEAL